MQFRELIVDGKMSGTGVRSPEGDYFLNHDDIPISRELSNRIEVWLMAHQVQHFKQFRDEPMNDVLDREGLQIAYALKAEHPHSNVRYFSDITLKYIEIIQR